MKDLYNKDKYLYLSVFGMAGLALVVGLLLLSFVWSGNGNLPSSNIPSYDKTTIQVIKDALTSRQDVDTAGKPNVSRFTFGNAEPF